MLYGRNSALGLDVRLCFQHLAEIPLGLFVCWVGAAIVLSKATVVAVESITLVPHRPEKLANQ